MTRMESVLRQVAIRYVRRPTLLFIPVLTLTIGIGPNIAAFAAIRAVLLSELSYPEADRIVSITRIRPGVRPQLLKHSELPTVATPNIEAVAGCSYELGVARGRGASEDVIVTGVTKHFFEVFATRPSAGLVLSAAMSDQSEQVVVISDSVWSSQFQRSADAVGAILLLNRQPWTVIGIMPPEFAPPCAAGDPLPTAWIPIQARLTPARSGQSPKPADPTVAAFIKLARGASIVDTRDELRARLPRVSDTAGEVALTGLGETDAVAVRPGLMFLQAMAFVVLLVTSANLAMLSLAQLAGRVNEIDTRLAIGASRADIVRQFTAEGAVIAFAGTLSATLAAYWFTPRFARLAGDLVPSWANVTVGFPEFGAGILSGAIAMIVFGFAPALAVVQSHAPIRHRLGGSSSRVLGRARPVLVAVQVGLAVVVVGVAFLMCKSLVRLASTPLGFDSRDVLIVDIPRPSGPEVTPESVRQFAARVEQALRLRMTGVDLAIGNSMPYSASVSTSTWHVVDNHTSEGRQIPAELRLVSNDFFDVLRIRIVQGDGLRRADDRRAAVVNETFARRLGAGSPLGMLIQRRGFEPYVIVGVAADTRSTRSSIAARPAVYVPLSDSPPTRLAIAVRSDDRARVTSIVRELIHAIDPDVPVTAAYAVRDEVRRREGRRSFLAAVSITFGTITMVLVLVGVIGLVSNATRAKAFEFALRTALGGQPRQLRRALTSRALYSVMVGLVVGGLSAILVGRLLRHNSVFVEQLHEVQPTDLGAVLGAASLILIGATLACWIPTRQILRTDPAAILKSESVLK